jgi:hypothetical protein
MSYRLGDPVAAVLTFNEKCSKWMVGGDRVVFSHIHVLRTRSSVFRFSASGASTSQLPSLLLFPFLILLLLKINYPIPKTPISLALPVARR